MPSSKTALPFDSVFLSFHIFLHSWPLEFNRGQTQSESNDRAHQSPRSTRRLHKASSILMDGRRAHGESAASSINPAFANLLFDSLSQHYILGPTGENRTFLWILGWPQRITGHVIILCNNDILFLFFSVCLVVSYYLVHTVPLQMQMTPSSSFQELTCQGMPHSIGSSKYTEEIQPSLSSLNVHNCSFATFSTLNFIACRSILSRCVQGVISHR